MRNTVGGGGGECCDSTKTVTAIPAGQGVVRSIALEVTLQQHHGEGDAPEEGKAADGFAIDQRDKSHRGLPSLCPALGDDAPWVVSTQSPQNQAL